MPTLLYSVKIDKTFLTLINLTYEGAERERHLKAFNKYPTLLGDCPKERQRKEGLRKEYLKRLLNECK